MNLEALMNEKQAEAIRHTDGPLLILAGAGSGKTRVLTHRAAYLIEECGVNPYHILAITFTNKAAGEMRDRIDDIVGFGSESIWVATFHSTCVRILRRFIDRIGYENHFSIYDTDDQKSVMKEIIKKKNLDAKIYKPRTLLSKISRLKDELITPEEFALSAQGDFADEKTAEVYHEYQKVLKKNNALDFDDLIAKTVELLRADPEVLAYYQNRFQYIMVDEYQDTNTAQFELIRLLAGGSRNLCVVGDDDQSIYKFRGANIQNILSFEEHFPDAKVIKLEQNYRSTQNILDAANGVIRNNFGRKEKALWTDHGAGDRLIFMQFENAYEEAEHVAFDIARQVREGRFGYGESAVLYRTNAQSRLLEEKMVALNIPYRIIGGINFYSRREIKDLLAYLKTIDNAQDDLSVIRILNVPKRGIGAASVSKVETYAAANGLNFFEALTRADEIQGLGRTASKMMEFVNLIRVMRSHLAEAGIEAMLEALIETSRYMETFKDETEEEQAARIENIDELISKVADFEETTDEPTLTDFLAEVSLVADIDSMPDTKDYVALMTLHSAKGLEYANVYMTGMEDGLFPGYMSITSDDPTEIEEERRLCYVGITRAKERLTLTASRLRMNRGELQYNKVSRFIREIPSELLSGNLAKERQQPVWQTANAGMATARKAFHAPDSHKSSQTAGKRQVTGQKPDYDVGDRVRHAKFGEGRVVALEQGKKDYEVTVEFDTAGRKKMFAGFAKMQKV